MDLEHWLRGRTGIVSIDTDFFLHRDEQQLVLRLARWLEEKAGLGTEFAFRDEHVELVELMPRPVDFILNLDFHMDCRVEFLLGDAPRAPACSASIFETLLAEGLAERYIWAFPSARRRQAAIAYGSGLVAGRQPLLSRIHCVSGRHAVDRLLGAAAARLVFVCRSPAYATADTDAAYDRLRAAVGPTIARR